MSITALVWALLYCAAIVSSLVNPLYASLGYFLEYYMRPELKWWGDDLPALRWNLIVSIALAVSFLIRRTSLRPLVAVRNLALPWLLALGGIMLVVSVTVAVDPDVSWNWMLQWDKMALVFPLLLVGVIRSSSGFNLVVAANMLGGFWWGWEAWRHPKRSAGRLMAVGSGDTFNDNDAAAHLLTLLPLVFVYLLAQKDKRLRLVALIAAPFVINTLVLCNSRGAVVGLAAAGAAAIFLIRPGYRMRLAGVGVAILCAGFLLADNQFIHRQQTMNRYEDDGSAQERLVSWKGAIALVKDRPYGAGGRGFHLLSPQYIPEVVEANGGELRATHNTWAMVATEWGILGLVCFAWIYASAFRMLSHVKKSVRPGEDGFYYWRAFALQLSIIGYLVAGVFADRVYGEVGYWLVALSYALCRVQRTEQADATQIAPVAAA